MPQKQKPNMFAAAVQRQEEQKEIETAVTIKADKNNKIVCKKRGSDATTITLSISKEDKVKVKSYAAKNSKAVSDLLHQWIEDNCK